MTVLVTVMAPPGRLFKGSSILLAAQDLRLGLHRSGIFDCFPQDASQSDPVFRIAHLREPGVFDINTVGKLNTPGLLLFMQLPGPMEPPQALERMMAVAKELADKLGGSICDADRHKMTTQLSTQLRNKVVEFDQQLKRYQPCF
jgi:cell division protein ZipA